MLVGWAVFRKGNLAGHLARSLFYSSRSIAVATLRQLCISSVNRAGGICWAASVNACSGSGCTSIISPSAPAAIAALLIGSTMYAWPVP